MNKFILEPTDENLERFKKLKEQQFIGIQPIFSDMILRLKMNYLLFLMLIAMF